MCNIVSKSLKITATVLINCQLPVFVYLVRAIHLRILARSVINHIHGTFVQVTSQMMDIKEHGFVIQNL